LKILGLHSHYTSFGLTTPVLFIFNCLVAYYNMISLSIMYLWMFGKCDLKVEKKMEMEIFN